MTKFEKRFKIKESKFNSSIFNSSIVYFIVSVESSNTILIGRGFNTLKEASFVLNWLNDAAEEVEMLDDININRG